MKKTMALSALFLASSFSFAVDMTPVKIQLNNQGLVQQTAFKKYQNAELQNQKEHEMNLKYSSCISSAEKNFANKQPQMFAIRGWILMSWIKCANEWMVKTKETEPLKQALNALGKNTGLLSEGTWKERLKTQSMLSRMNYAETLFTKNVLTWKDLSLLSDVMESLDREQKSRYHFFAGDLAQKGNNKEAAKQFYEQSLLLKENSSARLKLQQIQNANNKNTMVSKTENKEAESEILQRLKANEKSGDYVGYVREANIFLAQTPGHKEAENILNKVPELYLSLKDKAELAPIREKYLEVMMEGNPFHLAQWSRLLHRRGELTASYKLSSLLTTLWKGSRDSEVHFYVAARSAHMLGMYENALSLFESYSNYFPAGENIQEMLFRSGLVYYRLRDWNHAAVQFEKVMANSTESSSKYDLSARYWLVRSLQNLKIDRASDEIKALIAKYPFSYYGLRLLAEKENQSLIWPSSAAPTPVEKTLFVLPNQKQQMDKIKILSDNGWLQEAFWESATLPDFVAADAKVVMAGFLSGQGIYQPAIRWVNEAMDLGENYRAFNVIKLSFPMNYTKLMEAEGMKNQLNPILIKSLIRQESAFFPFATSTSNAVGLMQMIPPTAQEIASDLKIANLTLPEDLYVPENNIPMGSHYLAKVIRQFGGHVPLGLAAYNAGPTRLQQFLDLRNETKLVVQDLTSDVNSEIWFDELPWYETSFYVKAILRNTMIYKLLEKNSPKNSQDKRRVLMPSVLWKDLVIQPTES